MRALTDGYQPPARPWHELARLYRGKGAVGRLHDLCTGAVEPQPHLSIGAWRWDTLDPRGLGEADRRVVLEWRAQLIGAAYACGTVFEIGDLGHQAREAIGRCPAGQQHPSASQAFVEYVSRHPETRESDDLLAVATAALREAGCRAPASATR